MIRAYELVKDEDLRRMPGQDVLGYGAVGYSRTQVDVHKTASKPRRATMGRTQKQKSRKVVCARDEMGGGRKSLEEWRD
jgi:hypothetical protein